LSYISCAFRTHIALGVDVRDVCRNARTTNHIVQRKLADSRIELQEKGERLTDATRGTEDRDFGSLEAFSSQPMPLKTM
jgi:hypothetical protein